MKNNIDDLNLLRTFCKVSELGSFSKAAVDLKQPKSRVSRAISRLEEDLKTQLIRRTTRSFSLTDQGRQFYQKVHPLMDSLSLELSKLDVQSNEISGPIRITAPDDVGQYLLAEVIQKFARIYPKVTLNLELTNDVRDLTSNDIDVAFRIGRLKDSTNIQSLLTKINLIFVASHSYFEKNGEPPSRTDIHQHRLLLLEINKKPMKLGDLEEQPQNIFTCSNFPLLYQMVKSDFGIGLIPDFYCWPDVQQGVLKQIFPGWQVHKASLHLVYPSPKNLPKRVRLFIDFAKAEIKKKLTK